MSARTKILSAFSLILLCFFVKAQNSVIEKKLPDEFKALEKYNKPLAFKFDSVTVYAICTGFISTDKKFPEPVFVWLVKTPVGNYLIDAGLAPNITEPDYFKGISHSFFNKQSDFYIYKSNNLIFQLRNLGVDSNIKSIILTHGHFDHIGYLPELPLTKVILSETEKNQIKTLGQTAGYEKGTDRLIDFKRTEAINIEKDEIKSLNPYVSLIKTGNHTKGHMMILISTAKEKILFTGDINLKKLPKEDLLYKFLDSEFKIDSLKLFFNHDQNL